MQTLHMDTQVVMEFILMLQLVQRYQNYEFKKGFRDRTLLLKVRKQGGKHALASIGHST